MLGSPSHDQPLSLVHPLQPSPSTSLPSSHGSSSPTRPSPQWESSSSAISPFPSVEVSVDDSEPLEPLSGGSAVDGAKCPGDRAAERDPVQLRHGLPTSNQRFAPRSEC
jgi:hypothetical protein